MVSGEVGLAELMPFGDEFDLGRGEGEDPLAKHVVDLKRDSLFPLNLNRCDEQAVDVCKIDAEPSALGVADDDRAVVMPDVAGFDEASE